MFKYQLGQTVFFMRDNKICSSKIMRRNFSDRMSGDAPVSNVTYNISDRNGTDMSEQWLFASVDDVVSHLRKNVAAL